MIGLFDSGSGGLSVARAIRSRLPRADLLYLADSAYCPYGPRSREAIQARSLYCAETLIAAGADMIVVACNTATAAAVDLLRERFSVPIIGMEPGVKPAVAASRRRSIAVLATSGTLASERFDALIKRHAADVRVATIAAPEFVTLVERGEFASAETERIVAQYMTEIGDADVIVLGCTHFPLLQPVIAAQAGDGIQIIDVNPAVAERTATVAGEIGSAEGGGRLQIMTTGSADQITTAAAHIWGEPVTAVEIAADPVRTAAG
jgi:glutamate racemase